MKHLLVRALLSAALFLGAAEKNLLPAKFAIYGKKSDNCETIVQKNGQVDCFIKNKDVKDKNMTGCVYSVRFPKAVTGTLTFGAESKGEKVVGRVDGNYCIYLDLTYADGTRLYGQIVSFKNGTNDWNKVTRTIKLAKPVKSLSYYVLFRNVEGKASFRNAFLYNK